MGDLYYQRKGAGHVPAGQGELVYPRRQGRCGVPPGGDEAGGAAEEGEEGAVDGVIGGPRVGKERQLP